MEPLLRAYNVRTMKKGVAGAQTVRVGGIQVATGSHAGKTIYISSDHRGFLLKRRLSAALRRRGWKVADRGPHRQVSTDYPLAAVRAARAVGRSGGRRGVGIGICGSSIGMMIAAAKISGVHPANPPNVAGARTTRRHNNSNFLALAAERTPFKRALAIVLAWLAEPFYSNPAADRRYLRRYLETAGLDRQRGARKPRFRDGSRFGSRARKRSFRNAVRLGQHR